jgi:hypothetical protein
LWVQRVAFLVVVDAAHIAQQSGFS